MSKIVKIPDCMQPNFICHINGRTYSYPAGAEMEVPEEVAVVIENHMAHRADLVPGLPPSGSRPGGVSSWNDLTDKPFGDQPVVVLPEEDVTLNRYDIGEYKIDLPFALELSEDYIVRFNGKDYACKANRYTMVGEGLEVFGQYVLVLGNLAASFTGAVIAYSAGLTSAEDTGEPFCIVQLPASNAILYHSRMDYLGWDQSVTIGVQKLIAMPIEEKYLPEQLQIGEEKNAVLLPETKFVSGLMEGALVAMGAVVELVEGHTYTVNWNGVDYETVCSLGVSPIDGSAMLFLGNPAAAGLLNNNLPFAIGGNEQGLAAIPLDGSTSATVSIIADVVYKLEEKFLPNAAIPVWVDITNDNGTYTTSFKASELLLAHKAGCIIMARVRSTDTPNVYEDCNVMPLINIRGNAYYGAVEFARLFDTKLFDSPVGMEHLSCDWNIDGTVKCYFKKVEALAATT